MSKSYPFLYLLAALLTTFSVLSGAARAYEEVYPAPADRWELLRLQFTCADDIHAVLGSLTDYQWNILNIAPQSSAEENFARIIAQLRKTQLKSPDCFPIVFNSYVLGSILSLHRQTGSSELKYFWNVELDPAYRGIAQIASVLAQRHTFHALWPEVRDSWSGIYADKVEYDGAIRSRVMGVYGCRHATIWIDPQLRPLDFAATAMHEIVHLMQDKFGTDDDVVSEELLGSLHASWAQFRLKTDLNREREQEVSNSKKAKLGLLPQDLRLFSMKGPLFTTWKRNVLDQGFPLSGLFTDFFIRLQSPILWEAFTPAIEIISRAYGFNTRDAIDKFNSFLSADKPDLLSNQAQMIANQISRKSFRGSWGFAYPNSWREYIMASYFDDESIPELVSLDRSRKSISAQCSRRLATPILLGVEGGKPGVEGGKPGVEGGKPGVEGGKPGVEGGKPGVEGGRPCLRYKL